MAAPDTADVRLVQAVVRGEAGLAAFLDEAAARHPVLVPQLAPLQRTQRAHVTALQQAVQPALDSGKSAAGPTVPRRAAAVQPLVVELVTAERQQRRADCLAAESGGLARMLASILASHAVTLDGLATRR